jgi:hypothetical protein
MKIVQTEIPEKLHKGAAALAKQGWFRIIPSSPSEAFLKSLILPSKRTV